MKYRSIINLNKTIAKEIFTNIEYPFEILPNLRELIIELGSSLNEEDYLEVGENIWIGKDVYIDKESRIEGPAIIDDGAIIRKGAYVRENVIIGKNTIIGNCSEIKNSIIFDSCQISHFNYVGDSILGYKVHMGAGAIISNLKNDRSNVIIRGEKIIDTNLRKFGSIVGDNTEIGCNSVVYPGTIIYPRVSIYPLVRVRGVIEEDSIVKDENDIIKKEDI